MSCIRLYRKNIVTPVNSNSPVLQYFTPAKKKQLLNNKHSSSKPVRVRTTERFSVECYRKRQIMRKKFMFYRKSPATPLYDGFQAIKKKLEFSDDEADMNENMCKGQNNSSPIPTIVFNAGTPHKERRSSCQGYNECCSNSTGECVRSERCCCKSGLQSSKLHLGKCNMATPNTIHLLNNISPLANHKILGRGRFGCVIESQYKGHKIAIKVIDLSKRKLTSSIIGEHNAINLIHPNVIRIYSITWPRDKINGHYCLIMMECCSKARDLQWILDSDTEREYIDAERICRYCIDICNGLRFLHSKNILHLDVKPKNILVCPPDDLCKLCDFGTSVKHGNNINHDNFLFQFRGTAQYCSPEILQGHLPSPASDIYSFGITMWQFVHGGLPYGNIMEESLIYRVVKEDLRPPDMTASHPSQFIRMYGKLFTMCWAKKPEDRCSTDFILKTLFSLLSQCS